MLVSKTTSKVLIDWIDRALLYAMHVHGGQVRKGIDFGSKLMTE
jgi:hypothetical protein